MIISFNEVEKFVRSLISKSWRIWSISKWNSLVNDGRWNVFDRSILVKKRVMKKIFWLSSRQKDQSEEKTFFSRQNTIDKSNKDEQGRNDLKEDHLDRTTTMRQWINMINFIFRTRLVNEIDRRRSSYQRKRRAHVKITRLTTFSFFFNW